MDRHGDTRFQFAYVAFRHSVRASVADLPHHSLHLRQRLTEQAIEQGLNDLDHEIHFQHKLISWTEDESAELPIRCTMEAPDGSFYEVHW